MESPSQHPLIEITKNPGLDLGIPGCNRTALRCIGENFAFLCTDSNGWAILSPEGALNSCFVDSAILLLPSVFLLVFGPFDLLIRKKSQVSSQHSPWYQNLKLVWLYFFFLLASKVY